MQTSNSQFTNHHILVTAASLALLGVLLGAFGAHGLKSSVTPERLITWQTGVQYQFYHALGLLVIGLFREKNESKLVRLAMNLMLAGVLIFSGSLYLLVLLNLNWLGMITPVGGVLMILGWLLFVIYLFKQPAPHTTSDS